MHIAASFEYAFSFELHRYSFYIILILVAYDEFVKNFLSEMTSLNLEIFFYRTFLTEVTIDKYQLVIQ